MVVCVCVVCSVVMCVRVCVVGRVLAPSASARVCRWLRPPYHEAECGADDGHCIN